MVKYYFDLEICFLSQTLRSLFFVSKLLKYFIYYLKLSNIEGCLLLLFKQ